MEELTRIANDYFGAFEGRRHYPPWLSWQWLLWGLTLALWIASMISSFGSIRARQENDPTMVYVLEVLFIASSFVIENYKRRSLISANRVRAGATRGELDESRSRYLSHAFGKRPSEFAPVAQDAQALVAMHDRLRSDTGAAVSGFWRSVYDGDQNARLTGIFVGALAIFVSLLVVGLPPDAPSIVEVVASQDFASYMYFCLGAGAVLFGIGWMVRLIWFKLLEMSSVWGARLGSRSSFARMKVNYMLRDLVRLHEPKRTEIRRGIALKHRQRERHLLGRGDGRGLSRGRRRV